MQITFHKQFKKRFDKLPKKIKDHFYSRLDLLIKDKDHIQLNNHSVDKAYNECRSINVTGDYRAIFKEEPNLVIFIDIGTHSELY